MFRPAVLLSMLLALAVMVRGQGSIKQLQPLPPFSWDTLPVGYHGGSNRSPEDIDYLARFHLVVVDKKEGWTTKSICNECTANASNGCNEESRMLATLHAVKRVNSSVITMGYMNSLLNFPNYALANAVYADNGRLATHDDKGALIRFHADGKGSFSGCPMLAFDWGDHHTRKAWLNTIQRLRANGSVDGFYIDKSNLWPGYSIGVHDPKHQRPNELCQHQCYNLTNKSAQAWTGGKLELLRALNDSGPVCGGGVCTVDSGFLTEAPLVKLWNSTVLPTSVKFHKKKDTRMNNDTITLLRSLQGTSIKHLLWYAGHCSTEKEIAFFLIVAWPGMYCVLWPAYTKSRTAKSIWEQNPHWTTPLGAPTADAVLQGTVWSRTFAKGVTATFDVAQNNGTVVWGPANEPVSSSLALMAASGAGLPSAGGPFQAAQSLATLV